MIDSIAEITKKSAPDDHFKSCEICGTPMLGILAISEICSKSPRKICATCEQITGKNHLGEFPK